jgi:hypothetical protein
MSEMSDYCKAYPVDRFRAFTGWRDPAADGDVPDEYWFLHDNLTVTRGVFKNEALVFDQITDEWRTFCEHALEFRVPTD